MATSFIRVLRIRTRLTDSDASSSIVFFLFFLKRKARVITINAGVESHLRYSVLTPPVSVPGL